MKNISYTSKSENYYKDIQGDLKTLEYIYNDDLSIDSYTGKTKFKTEEDFEKVFLDQFLKDFRYSKNEENSQIAPEANKEETNNQIDENKTVTEENTDEEQNEDNINNIILNPIKNAQNSQINLKNEQNEQNKKGRIPKKLKNSLIREEKSHSILTIDNCYSKIKVKFSNFIISFFNIIFINAKGIKHLKLQKLSGKENSNITKKYLVEVSRMKMRDYLSRELTKKANKNFENPNKLFINLMKDDEFINNLLNLTYMDFYEGFYLGNPCKNTENLIEKYPIITTFIKKAVPFTDWINAEKIKNCSNDNIIYLNRLEHCGYLLLKKMQ